MSPDVEKLLKSEEYFLFHQAIEKTGVLGIPHVTGIISKTKDPQSIKSLQRWKDKQIEILGIDGFQKLQQDIFYRGKDFHNCLHSALMGKTDIELTPEIEGYWRSIQHVIESIKLEDVKFLEHKVTHPLLHYSGKVDCVAMYRNTVCLIEWKTSERDKPFISNTYDIPLQALAYVGAINSSYDPEIKKIGTVTNAVLVIAYPWGQPAHVHYLNDILCERYWAQWLEKIHLYWTTVRQECGQHKQWNGKNGV